MSVKTLFPVVGTYYITDRLYSPSKENNIHEVVGGYDRILFKVVANEETGGFQCEKLAIDKDFATMERKEEYSYTADGIIPGFEGTLIYRLLERVTVSIDETKPEGTAGRYTVVRTGEKYESPQKVLTRVIAESKDIMEVIDRFKVGFELETQSSGGFTANEWENQSGKILDKKATAEFDKLKSNREFLMQSTYIKGLLNYVPKGIKQSQLIELLDITDFEKLCDYFELSEDKASKDLKQGIKNKLYEMGPLAALDTETEGLFAKRDGTVKGFEFTPKEAGVSVQDFMNLCEKLYKVDHEIDKQCSFHIHVSVNGVHHGHSTKLQQAMYEYLLFHAWDRMPNSVKERLKKKDWRDSYFKSTLGTDKYHMVAFRGKTWEFRLFGNIQNAEDAATCLQLALEAMKHAYRVKFKLSSLMYPDCRDYAKAIDNGPDKFKAEMDMELERAA